MSYQEYTIDGYGISNEWDCTTSREKIEKLLECAPRVSDTFHKALGIDYDIEDINEYDTDCGGYGIFGLLCDVINEVESIEFCWCSDFDDTEYILFITQYPWRLTEEEKSITEKDIENILKKYTTILFGHPFDVDYYSCENGG